MGKEDKVIGLVSVIKEFKPNVIYVPYFIDWHEEHILTMQLLASALKELLKNLREKILVAMYQVSVPIDSCFINASIPMNKKDLIKKWEVFKSFYKT